ncbi:MAG TPA: acyltransferase family protein [Acidimicrobiales bacterium]|nr:acyltransferase family protein [Acidimicrobiales bacterium]
MTSTVEPVAPGASAPTRGPAAGRPVRPPRPIGYVAPVDGLRAVAVALVIAYHLGYSGVAGGYIGVEVFFLISGWLVCALLMNEHQRTGGIALGAFWVRRIRRLLPAMAAVVVATLAVASAVQPERLAMLRTQAVAALGYHLNWRLVLDEQSYFEAAGGPSALEHLWSLSIEEQFYLLFPLLAVAVLARCSRARAVRLVTVLALASTLLRLVLQEPGADPSRLYFGTDTRLSGLLLGVALGLFWTPNRLRPHADRRFTTALDVVAAVGGAVLAWYVLALDEGRPAAFGAGFTAVQLATLAVLAVAVYPAPTATARLLSAAPLRWVGKRSYGIYLVHWPVIVFLSDAPGEQPDPVPRVAVQVALVLGLAALSYRYLEQPIRRRGLRGSAVWARGLVADLAHGRPAAAVALFLVGVLTVTAVGSVAWSVADAEAPRETHPASVVIGRGGPTSTAAPSPPAVPRPTAPVPTPPPTAAPPAPSPPTSPAHVPTTAIGDSVLVGAAQALAHRLGPSLTVDAAVGRQLTDATDLVAAGRAGGTLGRAVVLHLGTNGPFTAEEVDALVAAAGPDRLVVLVNVLVPRRWEGEVNREIQAAADRHPNVRLADWHAVASSEPGLLREDGFHVTPAGAERFADLVAGLVPSS